LHWWLADGGLWVTESSVELPAVSLEGNCSTWLETLPESLTSLITSFAWLSVFSTLLDNGKWLELCISRPAWFAAFVHRFSSLSTVAVVGVLLSGIVSCGDCSWSLSLQHGEHLQQQNKYVNQTDTVLQKKTFGANDRPGAVCTTLS